MLSRACTSPWHVWLSCVRVMRCLENSSQHAMITFMKGVAWRNFHRYINRVSRKVIVSWLHKILPLSFCDLGDRVCVVFLSVFNHSPTVIVGEGPTIGIRAGSSTW
jgi:hypothetical protein